MSPDKRIDLERLSERGGDVAETLVWGGLMLALPECWPCPGPGLRIGDRRSLRRSFVENRHARPGLGHNRPYGGDKAEGY
jgi:hypothetical protein